MRIPFRKVWRAFPQFDLCSDADCRRMCRTAMCNHSMIVRVLPALTTLLGSVGGFIGFLWVATGDFDLELLSRDLRTIVLGPTITIGAGGLAGLLMRDLILYFALGSEIARTNCPKCRQSMLGLRVLESAMNPGTPGDARVRCPECGTMHVLLELGLAARDLIPYEQRGVPRDVARLRRDRPVTDEEGFITPLRG